MGSVHYAALTLRLIAARAEKLASDVQSQRLWEREYENAVSELKKYVDDLPRSLT